MKIALPEKINTPIIIIYFIVVGSIYQWAYWSIYDINFYEFTSSWDFVKTSIIPILNYFILIFLGFMYGVLNSVIRKKNPVKEASFWKQNRVDILTVIIAGLAICFGSRSVSWTAGFIFFYIWFIHALSETCINLKLGLTKLQFFTLFFSIVLPVGSYTLGKSDSYKIFDGSSYKYIANKNASEYLRSQSTDDFKYIGKLDKYIFLTTVQNTPIFIIEADSMLPLVLSKHSPSEHSINDYAVEAGTALHKRIYGE